MLHKGYMCLSRHEGMENQLLLVLINTPALNL